MAGPGSTPRAGFLTTQRPNGCSPHRSSRWACIESLTSDHRKQPEFVVVLRAGGGGEHQQRLGLIGIDQNLTMQRDRPDLWLDDSFVAGVGHGDLVLGPQRGELGALDAELPCERGCARTVAFAGSDTPEVSHVDPAVRRVVLRYVDRALVRIGEPAVDDASRRPREVSLVAEQG